MATGAPRIEDAYFAPENQLIFKLVDASGAVREFERDFSRPGHLRSVGDWDGELLPEGQVVLRSWRQGKVESAYRFERGRLVESEIGGVRKSYDRTAPHRLPQGVIPPLAPVDDAVSAARAAEFSRQEMAGKWNGTGRLSFPFANPNQSSALYVEVALVALAAFVFFAGWWKRAVALSLFAASVLCVLWCGSRGGMLGLLAGLAVLFAGRFSSVVRARAFWICLVASALLVAGWLLAFGTGDLMRGFTHGGGVSWSNAIRLDMWKASPQMMAAAPGGWGFCGAGRAYLDWFQPLSVFCLTGSLMNDHLTWLVSFGTCGRVAYLFAFVLIVLIGLRETFVCHRPFFLSVWSAFAVMAWFNPVFDEWTLWVVPVLSLLAAWNSARPLRLKQFGLLAGVAFVTAVLVLWAIVSWVGASRQVPSIAVEGNRVLINGRSPRTWVVDDCRGALGGLLVGKDIRDYYSAVPHAGSIGYVRSIDDLPASGVERLVLAGKAGNDWLMRLSEDESARTRLPKSVLFISPPFPPSAIPEGVRMTCRPEILVGEFAAAYDPEYGRPTKGVTVAEGMELYVMMWLERALER